ncbi:MAG: mucoidy inhibitor MuiA family protein [Deltaproteobacteria bacterium]|nr:MAG: mucoidy inhibitor MuiA family protein [Deltaproteobacteria bacterium]
MYSFALVIALFATQASAGSRVDRVVVFADRAEVTRVTEAKCSAGKAKAVFKMLPVGIDVRTLRAEAAGSARALGTSFRKVTLEHQLNERARKLELGIRKLDDEIRMVDERRAGIEQRMQRVGGYRQYFVTIATEGMRNARPDVSAWEKVLDYFHTEQESAVERMAKLAVKRRELVRRRQVLQRRLLHVAPIRRADGYEVAVAVDCGGKASARVSLSYVVPSATWRPEYDVRFTPSERRGVGPGRIELGVSVVVRQSTGEDWQDAKLVLSTAKPRLGTESPYPAKLTVYAREGGKQKVLVEAMERRESLAGRGQRPAGAAPAYAALEDRGQSFALVMPRRVTVLADGRPYWMPLDSTSTRARAVLVTIPKLRPVVYQVARFKNPAPYPLLAGRAHVYRRGAYQGDVRIKYTAPGEPMEVSLGTDGRFRVERRELKDKDRGPGFFSSTKHIERAYRIMIHSSSRRRHQVEVVENIPVSKIEDVKVELQRKRTTPGFSLDEQRGFLTWKLLMDPGADKGVELAYTIHLPEDWKVNISR